MTFSWSWSRIKNYETCPRRYQHYDVLKDVDQTPTLELQEGDDLHVAMHKRVKYGPEVGKLPEKFVFMEPWAASLSGVLDPDQKIECELKLALDRNLKPTTFFSKTAWYRGVLDYLRTIPSTIFKGRIAHIVDYKTGKPKDEPFQLALNAQLVFAHYPEVVKIRTDYLWCRYGDTTHESFSRDDMPELWAQLLPRVKRLQDATEANEYPAKPNGLCKDYCQVVACEHWGKRSSVSR